MRRPPRYSGTTSHVRRRHLRDEGNIIVAVMVLMVLVTVGTVMAGREIGNGLIVSSRQSTSAALASADAGLADALFHLNQPSGAQGNGVQFYVDSTQSGSCTSTCVGNAVVNPMSGLPAGSNVKYLAQKVNDSQWTIDSVGLLRSQSAAVHETVSRAPEYPFALFANSSLTFNGHATGSFSTYDDSQTGSATNPDTNGNVAIGSNGSITCNGGIGSNVQTDFYGTASVSSMDASGCGNEQSNSTTYYLPPVSTAGVGGSLGCPNGGNIGSGFGYPTLSTGTWICTHPVTINGLLKVPSPVIFYIDLSGGSYNSSTAALTIDADSYVNDMYDYCANNTDPPNCHGTQTLPNADNLELKINSNGQVGFDNGHGYYFGGILYAPQAYLTQDGCKSHYFGSVTINTLTCNGGPHLYVSYDTSLSQRYGAWTVSGYTQENPSAVSVP